MIWYCRIQSTAVSKERDIRWCDFRYSIPLSIDYVWNSGIDMAISILSCSYCMCNRYWQNHRSILPHFLMFTWFWYARTQSSAMIKQQDIRWCGFRWSIPLSIDYVWNAVIDMAILKSSCSYCIFNRWCQNHRSILPNFLLFAWFHTVEFNRWRCSNNKMYDDMVFNDRFSYQLTMFKV